MIRLIVGTAGVSASVISLVAFPFAPLAQAFQLGELNTRQFQDLDRDRTAVITPLLLIVAGSLLMLSGRRT